MSAPLVVSLSGGKDSTAMLLMLLERGEPVHSAVFFDTGWEFPQMHDHLRRLESYSGVSIVTINPRRPFVESMISKPVINKSGEIRFYGWGWPSPLRRWCTREKTELIDRYLREIGDPVRCIGFAADEVRRTETANMRRLGEKARFPLIEWGITEPMALAYCRKHGFDWSGLYDHFKRVSCFCCPLQGLSDLRKLRRHYPNLWSQMLTWESQMMRPEGHKRFKHEKSVRDLDARFREEDRQFKLPGVAV